ncbi:unnamed protein product, partial [Sphagnum troendelagicum]
TVFPHHGSHQQTWLQSGSYRKICRANFTNRHSFAMSNQLSSLHNTTAGASFSRASSGELRCKSSPEKLSPPEKLRRSFKIRTFRTKKKSKAKQKKKKRCNAAQKKKQKKGRRQ